MLLLTNHLHDAFENSSLIGTQNDFVPSWRPASIALLSWSSYTSEFTCKLDCTPYLSRSCRRDFFETSFQRKWGPQNRRNPISMLTKTKRNEKCTNQRNKNNIWKKVLVVSSLKLLLVLVLGYLGTTLQALLIILRDDNEEGNARGGRGGVLPYMG